MPHASGTCLASYCTGRSIAPTLNTCAVRLCLLLLQMSMQDARRRELDFFQKSKVRQRGMGSKGGLLDACDPCHCALELQLPACAVGA